MRLATIFLLALLAAAPGLAATPAEKACLFSMAERLPKLPSLRILRAELTSATPGFARAAPLGMKRLTVSGQIVTELAGVESSYGVTCAVLIDRKGVAAIEPDRSSLRPEG